MLISSQNPSNISNHKELTDSLWELLQNHQWDAALNAGLMEYQAPLSSENSSNVIKITEILAVKQKLMTSWAAYQRYTQRQQRLALRAELRQQKRLKAANKFNNKLHADILNTPNFSAQILDKNSRSNLPANVNSILNRIKNKTLKDNHLKENNLLEKNNSGNLNDKK